MNIQFSINGQPIDFDAQRSADGEACVQMHTDEFSGTVRKADLEEGLCFYLWNFTIEKSCTFLKEYSAAGDDKIYVVHYHPAPEYIRIEYRSGEKNSLAFQRRSTLFLLNCPGSTSSTYCQRAQLHRVMIVFNQKWLLDQLRDVKNSESPVDYIMEILDSAPERAMSKGEIALVQMLFDIFKGRAYSLEVKAHVYHLISFLYRRITVSAQRKATSGYRPLMVKVERRIMSSLSGNMPPLEELAQESLISVSTLKRQFKETFGVSIYDYYLTKKMELAEQLLQRANLPVGAVAFQLGYESSSHFTSIFKRFYGYPPGKVKKESIVIDKEV